MTSSFRRLASQAWRMVLTMRSNATEPAPSDRSASEQAEYERLRKQEINMYAQRRAIDRGREVTVPKMPRFASREEMDAWVAEKRRMDAELGRIQQENWRRREAAEKAALPEAER